MIISSVQVNAVLKSQSRAKNEKNTPCTERCPFITNTPDQSADFEVVTKVKEAIHNEAETRTDKVNALKNMITHGNYPISGEVVAEKMVDRSLVDSILGSKESNR